MCVNLPTLLSYYSAAHNSSSIIGYKRCLQHIPLSETACTGRPVSTKLENLIEFWGNADSVTCDKSNVKIHKMTRFPHKCIVEPNKQNSFYISDFDWSKQFVKLLKKIKTWILSNKIIVLTYFVLVNHPSWVHLGPSPSKLSLIQRRYVNPNKHLSF
jgi:hypothetical protein